MSLKMSKKKQLLALICSIVLIVILIVFAVLYSNGSFTNYSKPQEGDIRIACVGDSITYGAGVEDWEKNAYPVVLDNLLGNGYAVSNFGQSGATAMEDGDLPYKTCSVYSESLAFLPDIVVIMLGTNDAKSMNWQGADAYKEDYGALIDDYLALSSAPTVYVLLPPPAFTDVYGIDTVIANEVRFAAAEVAAERNLTVIDMYAYFEDKSDLIPDGVHPNAEGAAQFAQEVFEVITAT